MTSQWRYADDDSVLAERFAELERAAATRPRRPGVGDWVLDQDGSGNLVAVNLRTRLVYPVALGTPTVLPS